MRDLVRTVLVAAGLLASPAAWALPWNIDLTDSETVKAYEQAMRPLPEGVVAQPNVLTPIGYTRNYSRGTPEGDALTNPYPVDDAFAAVGEKMYGVYCTPCHGDGVNLGPVVAKGYPTVAKLGGETGRLKALQDGQVYLTIRNGFQTMPSYGWAMNDREAWAVVSWMRKGIADAAAPGTAAPAAPAAPATTPAAPAKEGQ
jgi:cytochrome c5